MGMDVDLLGGSHAAGILKIKIYRRDERLLLSIRMEVSDNHRDKRAARCEVRNLRINFVGDSPYDFLKPTSIAVYLDCGE